MLIKRCPLGSPECALFIVAQLLPRLLGGKSSVATKTHSGEQKSNSKDQQALVDKVLKILSSLSWGVLASASYFLTNFVKITMF
ncbi:MULTISPECIES: hypothetical protein [Pseudoalteromonas]|uniref:Uncharacterized protein n=3 Tax=Pseudoalteromonas TaxID=53246 RepID=A0ABM6NFZ8_PSEO7|nr:hypothetical protein [Pseudoalteromonas piscicida]ATD07852.1 hypothetical protein PPIS_a2975 [Pseudoalteromonas piscicida]WPU34439.1 hypothetical protein SIO17_12455 [Pseudoalteromonas piscicida]